MDDLRNQTMIEAEEQPAETPGSDERCQVYDVEVSKDWMWRRAGLILFVIFAFVILASITLASSNPALNFWVFACVALLTLVSLFMLVRRAGTRQRLDNLLEIARNGRQTPDAVWKEWLRHGLPFLDQNWHIGVAKKFANAGHRNCVVRAFFPGERRRILPIEHPFEPLGPDEDSAEFHDLFCGIFENSDAAPTPGSEKKRINERVGPWGRFQRAVIRNRLLINLIVPVFLATKWMIDWLSGRSSGIVGAIFIPIILLPTWFVLFTFNSLNGWYIVPGGLYIRNVIQKQMPRLWPRIGAAGRLIRKNEPTPKQLLTASNHLLLIFQYTRQHHHVVITDGTSAHTEIMTRKEADLLVSTWISSIKPPDPEWIEKLLEGCGAGTTGGATSEEALSAKGEANASG